MLRTGLCGSIAMASSTSAEEAIVYILPGESSFIALRSKVDIFDLSAA
jgi:hypothetical protein